MKKYYQILGINEKASVAEIKRAFRKKAKSTHPDLNDNGIHSNPGKRSQMHLIVEAYKSVLKQKKAQDSFSKEFDFFYQRKKNPEFHYRDWLTEKEDYQSRAKLIFFDLFNGNEEIAIQEYYTRKNEAKGFYLKNYFSREDFMDCAFVLAEELYFRKDYYESFLLLEKIFYLETEKPYFKHFFPEVEILIRSILNEKLNKFVDDDLAMDCYETALNFNLKKSDRANIHRQLSEIYYRFNDIQSAKIHLNEALRLSPKIQGLKILKNKLDRNI